MKPIYTTDFLDLHHCDNMELMAQYPDNYFDLAIVDPPYGINADENAFKNGINCEVNGFKKHKKNNWDNKTPNKQYFDELIRVSKNQIIWGANYFTDILPPKMSWIIWDKMQYNFTFSDGEMAWNSFDNKLKIFRYARGNESGFSPKSSYIDKLFSNIHPTQKPVKLYEWILSNYAKENDKILDTHFGSGSIALAVDRANKLDKINLHLTACELDKDYIDKSIERISQNIRQMTMYF